MNVCLYHRSDLDGHCGRAIYEHWCQRLSGRMPYTVHGMDYGDEIPWHLIDGNELTIIDWSFQPWSLFDEVLQRAKHVTWIDHHKSAIETYQESESSGSWCPLITVLNSKQSGCELAWQHFFPYNPMPEAVLLLGRYDVWDHADPRVLAFQYRMRLEETDAEDSYASVWRGLLDGNDDFDSLGAMIREGELLLRYQTKQDAGDASNTWFPLDWYGMRWQACNRTGKGSTFFAAIWDREKYHGMMAFGWTGKHWRIGLYSDRQDVDCSAIAKAHGGGGHRGAAGFQCEHLPFKLTALEVDP